MKTQRNIYDENNAVSPSISDSRGTWFLGRDFSAACGESLKGTSPRKNSGTWFLGRKERRA